MMKTEEDENLHMQRIVEDATRYVLAVIQQQDLRNRLNKMSKQAIVDYANRRGIDLYVSHMRKMSRFQLIENCLETFVNRVDHAEELARQGVETKSLDQLIHLYLTTREE